MNTKSAKLNRILARAKLDEIVHFISSKQAAERVAMVRADSVRHGSIAHEKLAKIINLIETRLS